MHALIIEDEMMIAAAIELVLRDCGFNSFDIASSSYEAIRAAVLATGKVIVLHEDTLTGGIGGEIAAWIGEHCFEHLDAPVMRCASLDTPIPFNLELEKNFMAYSRLGEFVERLVNY